MAFHPYPQLIPQVFNPGGFGPPRRLTVASPWPWVDHSASGPEHTTTPPQRVDTPYSDSLSLRLPLNGLTSRHVPDSQAHSPKGTPSPLAGLRLFVGTRFQVLFHSPPGVLFTIPSRYYPLSVAGECLALRGGPRRFVRNFTGSALLGSTEGRLVRFRLRDCSPLWSAFPCRFDYLRAL